MHAPSKVVVSGLGSVCSAGCGKDELSRAMSAGRACFSEIDRSAGYHRPGSSQLAALTSDLDLSPWLPQSVARRMSPSSRLAVAAATMAMNDAGLAPQEFAEGAQGSVFLSNPYGPASILERILLQILTGGPTTVSPALFTESVANAPAAQVAIRFAATGPNITVTESDAGVFIALKKAAMEIENRRSHYAFVLVVDELTPLLHSLLDRFRSLSRPASPGGECARPFDRHRNGYTAGEGATALLLESEESAARRGHEALARVVTAYNGFDPAAPHLGWSASPTSLATQMRAGLQRARVSASDIGCVVSCASGAKEADRLEAELLSGLWDGASLPPIITPKANVGSHSGALLSVPVLATRGCEFGATPGFEEPDPALGVRPHDGHRFRSPERVLATSLAPGGAASWAVFERAG